MLRRPRRNRKSSAIRLMTQETHLACTNLIAPYFVIEGTKREDPIHSLPGVSRLSIDLLLKEAEQLLELGIPAMALFPVIPKELKDLHGSLAIQHDSILHRAIREIKKRFPDLCLIADIALDPYTSHGHDGLVDPATGRILNDETVDVLARMAIAQAEAGIDIVAPSDMMDGRIGAIRRALDNSGFVDTSIMAYTAKYASSFYGPFREALRVELEFGDKKSYQMNPANSREALVEAMLDEREGADILMIKPGLPYLDVIAAIKTAFPLPVAAYHVSGEYAMLMAAAEKGWLDADAALYECLLSIKRAGADMILTYAAKRIAKRLKG